MNTNTTLRFTFVLALAMCSGKLLHAQSFSAEKISAINFVKRVHAAAPFEGVRKIDGEEANYYAVAVVMLNVPKDSALAMVSKAAIKAQYLAEQGFAEPCVKFEMIDKIEKGNQITYLFLCTTLEDFISEILRKKNIDGARIISAPGNKFVITTVTLENGKYTNPEMRDKAAFMKAKQSINILLNGSTISSEQIIRTDESDSSTSVTNTEVVYEHAMGFVQGLELLLGREIINGKTTYVYYGKI